jgi:hypothetical protein
VKSADNNTLLGGNTVMLLYMFISLLLLLEQPVYNSVIIDMLACLLVVAGSERLYRILPVALRFIESQRNHPSLRPRHYRLQQAHRSPP